MLKSSIALCTYHGERFLSSQLESLKNQSRLPDELVVCDDVSQDASVQIVEEFAKTAPFPVRIYRNPKNLGYKKNFEQAASLASGDVIFFCDQDDIWAPQKIERVMSVFESEPEVGMVFHRMGHIDADGRVIMKRNWRVGKSNITLDELAEDVRKNSIRSFICSNPLTCCGCGMAYRSCWNSVLVPFEDCLGHDFWVFFMLGICAEVRFLNEELIAFRHHENNTCDKSRRRFRFFVKLLNSAKKRWRRYVVVRKSKVEILREALQQRLAGREDLRHPELLEELFKCRKGYK